MCGCLPVFDFNFATSKVVVVAVVVLMKRKRRKNNLQRPPQRRKPEFETPRRIADFYRVSESPWATRRKNKFNKYKEKFDAMWRAGLGRASGCGISGTADTVGRQIVGYIFYNSIRGSQAHKAFTDIGCDFGEMMVYMAGACDFNSAWGVEIQPGTGQLSERDKRMFDWLLSAEERLATTKGASTSRGQSGLEMLFNFTTASLSNHVRKVEATFGVNIASDDNTHVYPGPGWEWFGIKERRCIFSFDVG